MFGMNRVLLSLFIVFSLLIAPIAHAADMDCKGDNCQVSEQAKKSSDTDKQDSDKMAKADHHCCCPHVSAIPNLAVTKSMTIASRTAFNFEQDATTSVVVGPPLKPPSHA